VVISVGLVSWIVWKVSPREIAAALSTSASPWLVLATVVQLVVLFLWDTLSLWWLFSQPDRRLPFRAVLRLRTDSALWTAVNLEIGQGVFAWELAKRTGMPVATALGRCVVLALFDFGTLQSLALAAASRKSTGPSWRWAVRWSWWSWPAGTRRRRDAWGRSPRPPATGSGSWVTPTRSTS
jgi:hypothetical protein